MQNVVSEFSITMVRIIRIADLDEALNGSDWAVVCRVVARFPARTFSRSGGEGLVQNAIIKDASGVAAQVAIFNESIESFEQELRPGSCVQIRNLSIKRDTHVKARWRWSLLFGASTSVSSIADLGDSVDMKWKDNRDSGAASAAVNAGSTTINAAAGGPAQKVRADSKRRTESYTPYRKPGPKNRISPDLVHSVTGYHPRDFVDNEAEEDDTAELHHHH